MNLFSTPVSIPETLFQKILFKVIFPRYKNQMNPANQFLADEFKRRKIINPNFSLRSFSKWIGMSPAQVSQMIAGKRTVTTPTLKRVADRVGLSPLEKETLISEILTNKLTPNESKRAQISDDKFRLIADWYHLAILSLTKLKGAKSDPRWIAKKLELPLETAHQALLRLERLGIIETKPKFRQIIPAFEASAKIPSPAIRNYHKQNLDLAASKLESVPMALREFQSISINLNKKDLASFKKMIDTFLDRASTLASEKSGDDIYHLNVQLFPVSTIEDKQ